MQNDNDDLAQAIEECVAQHTYSDGARLSVIMRGGTCDHRFMADESAGRDAPSAALRNMFEDVLLRGIAIGRKRTIDDMTKAGSDAVVKACTDLQTALDDREDKRSAFSNAESEVRVQEIMVEKAKKAGAAVYEIIKAIEGK